MQKFQKLLCQHIPTISSYKGLYLACRPFRLLLAQNFHLKFHFASFCSRLPELEPHLVLCYNAVKSERQSVTQLWPQSRKPHKMCKYIQLRRLALPVALPRPASMTTIWNFGTVTWVIPKASELSRPLVPHFIWLTMMQSIVTLKPIHWARAAALALTHPGVSSSVYYQQKP